MNPIQTRPTPTLRVVPKTPKVTLPLRRLETPSGIIWTMIPEVFARYHWDVQEYTELFIKAYHAKTNQMVILSRMAQGTVLINHDYRIFSASELHEIEALADIYLEREETAAKKKNTFRGVWITLMIMLQLFI